MRGEHGKLGEPYDKYTLNVDSSEFRIFSSEILAVHGKTDNAWYFDVETLWVFF